MANKTVQLASKNWCKVSLIAMFTYHRRSNLPVLQQIRLRQVALTLTSDWIKLSGSYVT